MSEKDKIFHAGPVNGGFGTIFFSLHEHSLYEFCDGDFMDYGCYTGEYRLSGDTIILIGLKKHEGIPTNKFLIRRYSEMDSSYWKWKYPDQKREWKTMRRSDLANSATGDVFPMDFNNAIVLDRNHSFLIRLDKL